MSREGRVGGVSDLDAVLREIDKALDLPEKERNPPWGGFHLIPLLGFGARIAVAEEREPDDILAPFVAMGQDAGQPHDLGADVASDKLPGIDDVTEYELECLVPSAEWTEEQRAWFWRAKAKAFVHDYADASLNLTADCIERALPWHREHAPLDALVLWAQRLRSLQYASLPRGARSPRARRDGGAVGRDAPGR